MIQAIYKELSHSQSTGQCPTDCLPTQAMTIPLQPKGLRGKKFPDFHWHFGEEKKLHYFH